jgi:hypothetical protein
MASARFAPEQDDCAAALSLMEQALELLDRADAPAEIGAHLDLAINRLRALPKSAAFRPSELWQSGAGKAARG